MAMDYPCQEASERSALRRRAKQMYDLFNLGSWEECFALIDPKLREASKRPFRK